jgi:hypothetical protein
LKRSQWSEPVEGELSIHNARDAMCASVSTSDVQQRVREMAPPLFDVRVMTFEQGFVVMGYVIQSESGGVVVREVRQAWYCVPSPSR